MRKSIVVALAVTASLLVGPAALAASAEPSGALPGSYSPQHAGHDHGKKDESKKKDKDDKKGKDEKKSKHGYVRDHGGGDHHHHGDGAHASGGYDSHREHPRNW